VACVLTHVQLPNETGHVAVLEVKRQHILGELDLVDDDKTASALRVVERVRVGGGRGRIRSMLMGSVRVVSSYVCFQYDTSAR
jgi:hypothetical protein